MQYFWVGIGGAFGSMLRFFLQGWVQASTTSLFPLGTLAVNLLGSAVVGFLGGLFESVAVPENVKVFLFVGVLGGFTTFSAFSLGNLTLIRGGQGRMAILYLLSTNVLGIALAFGGYFLARFLLRSPLLSSTGG